MKEYIPVNWALISHPMNWIIVLLMVYIALIAMNFFAKVKLFKSE